MKVLVIGGTGAIGFGVVKSLINQNIFTDIYVVARNEIELSLFKEINFIKADGYDLNKITEIIIKNKIDYTIDLLIYSEEQFTIRISSLLPLLKHYIHTSTVTVYSDNPQPIKEDSPRLKDTHPDEKVRNSREYRIEKARIEDVLINSNYSNWTIVRPHVTFGNNKIPFVIYPKEVALYRFINNRSIVLAKEMLPHITTMTTGEDVGARMVALLGKDEAMRQIVNIASNKIIKWEENIKYISEVLLKRGISNRILYCDLKHLIKNLPGDSYSILFDRLVDRRVSDKKINSILGEYNYSEIKESLQKCLNNFLDSGKFPVIDDYYLHYAFLDKFCHEHTPLREFNRSYIKLKYIIARWIFPISWCHKLFNFSDRVIGKIKRIFKKI